MPAHYPFFIGYDPPRAELTRLRAEHRAAQGETLEPHRPDLVALLARSPDPEADARRLAAQLGCAASGTTTVPHGAEVRFDEGEPAGLYGITVRGLDPAGGPVELAGLAVRAER